MERASSPTGFGQASRREPEAFHERSSGRVIPVLYVACSPFSGSTLLSFLLNTHPDVTTAGHTTGWAGLTPDFPCSCGAPVKACPFFTRISFAFERAGLSFPLTGLFPTAYSLSSTVPRLDQLAFENLPRLGATRLERFRDTAVRHMPWVGRRVAAVDRANRVFMNAALEYAGARVYVDNSHSPYRCRRLAAIPGVAVYPVHLVRDVRGVALSATEIYGWSIDFAALHWMQVQDQIVRVLKATPGLLPDNTSYISTMIFYEELCDSPETALQPIADRLGLPPPMQIDDFKRPEHHILGNEMRLGSGQIKKSQRWYRVMSLETQNRLEERCRHYATYAEQSIELEQILDRMFAD